MILKLLRNKNVVVTYRFLGRLPRVESWGLRWYRTPSYRISYLDVRLMKLPMYESAGEGVVSLFLSMLEDSFAINNLESKQRKMKKEKLQGRLNSCKSALGSVCENKTRSFGGIWWSGCRIWGEVRKGLELFVAFFLFYRRFWMRKWHIHTVKKPVQHFPVHQAHLMD